jgi:hypothetical protein
MTSCTLASYEDERLCPACGARAKHIDTAFEFTTGHVRRHCFKCDFVWLEEPLFNPGAPPIFRRTQTDKYCPACGSEKIDSTYVSDPDTDSFELRYRWGLDEVDNEYLNRALGAELASLVPFLGLKCTRCAFVWPELPLNRAEGPSPVLPPHVCTDGAS